MKGSVITRCFSEGAFIVAYVEVKHSSAGTTCELLGNLFGEWGNTRVLDGDGIERFEAVDWAKGFSFFLGYTEPAQTV